ncbi:uncharacterized protein LOC129950853 isoform X3 [Eupeodes corollae]|uniref:uncharacterized protein LOC129950853 isoform X3 n=1 Tax=Eupeodes corollae TaxID=290404 RepID=UPI002491A658|nr:uncharacterized protein LOC129950853 isoform X3 [Eupeodes corollae]
MLQILQINLQHSIKASASLLLLLSKTGEDVVLIQEPWILKSLVRGLRTPVYYVLYVTGKVIKTSPQTTIPTGWYQHIWATTTRAHCLVPYHTTWGSTDINDRGKIKSILHWTLVHVIPNGEVESFIMEGNMNFQWEPILFLKRIQVHNI